jgi:hypothetical protein
MIETLSQFESEYRTLRKLVLKGQVSVTDAKLWLSKTGTAFIGTYGTSGRTLASVERQLKRRTEDDGLPPED